MSCYCSVVHSPSHLLLYVCNQVFVAFVKMTNMSEYDLFPTDIPMAILPKLDLSKLIAGNATEAKALFDCCTQQGIFLLDLQHATDGQQLLKDTAEMFNLTERLFALEDVVKIKYLLNWEDVNGYISPFSLDKQPLLAKQPKPYNNSLTNNIATGSYKPLGGTKVDSAGTPDSCEFWTFSQNELTGLAPSRAQPSPITAHKPLLQSFMDRSKTLALYILSLLDPHLDLPSGTLSALHPPTKPSGSQIRLLRYPAQSVLEDHHRRSPASLVAHTDQGSLTLLFNILGGLQILSDPSVDTGPGNPQAETDWVYVRPVPGTVIVNCGDALRKWTGNVIKSPKHCVVPAPGKQAERVRYSVAYFARPEGEARMMRLGEGKGSRVIPPLGEGEVEEVVLAREWHMRMSVKHRSDEKKGGERARADTVELRSHGVA